MDARRYFFLSFISCVVALLNLPRRSTDGQTDRESSAGGAGAAALLRRRKEQHGASEEGLC